MAVQKDQPNPIVHKVSMSPDETRKAKTRLEEVLQEREDTAAQRYSAATLEQMALEAENEVARLRGEPPKHRYYGGEGMTEEEKHKKEEEEAKQAEQKKQLLGSAKALIESGMEPAQVGQMLLGLPTTANVPPAISQGMTVKDVLSIVEVISEKKEARELRDTIASLEKRVEELTKGGGRREETRQLTPIEYARQQAEAVVAWNEAIEQLKPASAPSEKGESLEVVKERNRHAEKMEEIKTDREYKENITDIATSIPERVGRGLAAQVGEESRESRMRRGGTDGMDYYMCSTEGCGTKIPVLPGVKTITCQKCGATYDRVETVESQPEAVESDTE